MLSDRLFNLHHSPIHTNVERPDVTTFHHSHHTLDQIQDILEWSCLRTVAVYCEWLIPKGLRHEVADDAPIVKRHSRSVRVEYSDNSNLSMETIETSNGIYLYELDFPNTFVDETSNLD